MRRVRLSARVRNRVAERAGWCCEYCRHRADYSNVPFEVEHILPLHAGGTNRLENLAYACRGCNGFKGMLTHAIDPLTGEVVALFHPRQQRWQDHFAWSADFMLMLGQTPTGRATVEALQLNRPGLQNLRRAMHHHGVHPPDDLRDR